MSSNRRKRLDGETVIFTGTPKSNEAPAFVEREGGTVYSYPLIQVRSIHEEDDEIHMKRCEQATWLIFTSQSSVASFREKMERLDRTASHFRGKIAAVGTKTAAALERLGFTVSFIPTIFSADVFVKQFAPTKEEQVDVVFLRGSLARSILRDGLPFTIKEWTIYETVANESSIEPLIETLRHTTDPTVLFASPSAVDVYAAHVTPHVPWERVTVAAIGHVTERALQRKGATVDIVPETYTMIDLVRQVAKTKGRQL